MAKPKMPKNRSTNAFGSGKVQGIVRDVYPKAHVDSFKPSDQGRKTITRQEIEERKRSLLKVGQLAPLLVIKENDILWIEDGEINWRSACELVKQGHKEFEHLEYKISAAKNKEEAFERSLFHQFHQSRFNPLDRATSVLRYICGVCQIKDRDKLVKRLNKINNKARSNKSLENAIREFAKNEVVTEVLNRYCEEIEIKILKCFIVLNLDVFGYISNDLRFALYPEDIIKAIREQEVSCAKAKVLNRINFKNLALDSNSDEDAQKLVEIRADLLQQLLQENLSYEDFKNRVERVIQSYKRIEGDRDEIAEQENLKIWQQAERTIKKIDYYAFSRESLEELKSVFLRELEEIEDSIRTLR